MTLLLIIKGFCALVAIIMFGCTLHFGYHWRTAEVLQEKFHCQAMTLLCGIIWAVLVIIFGLLNLEITWAPL